jgi:hypothetical protein
MNKKLLVILLLVLVLLSIGYAASRIARQNDAVDPVVVDDMPPTSSPGGIKVNPDGTTVGGTDKTPAPTPNPAPPSPVSNAENVVVTLSRVSVGSELVTVTGYADTTTPGTCALALSQAGQKTLTYDNPAELEVSTVSCNPFRIPRSDFPTKGEWRATITFRAARLNGTSNEWRFSL